jgi:hypothetical protein
MNLLWVLIIILLIFAVMGVPTISPIKHNYGYVPSGAIVVIIIVLVVLLLMGRL